MSASAQWANTAKATIWRVSGYDDWSNVYTFQDPLIISVSYSAKAKRLTSSDGGSSDGSEVVSMMHFWTEYSQAQIGDFIAIGEHLAVSDPLLAKASAIKSVVRDQDIFDGIADDYTLIT